MSVGGDALLAAVVLRIAEERASWSKRDVFMMCLSLNLRRASGANLQFLAVASREAGVAKP